MDRVKFTSDGDTPVTVITIIYPMSCKGGRVFQENSLCSLNGVRESCI